MHFGRTLAALALIAVSAQAAQAQRRSAPRPAGERVPKGAHILVDGRYDEREWRDARAVQVSDDVTVYAKQADGYVYVGVRPREASSFGVDLYLDRDRGARILNLHASAKLGEREGSPGAFPDWAWWNNAGWVANVVRVEAFEPRKFLADEIKEFQIRRDRIAGDRVWISLDVHTARGTQSVPLAGPTRHGRRWIDLRL